MWMFIEDLKEICLEEDDMQWKEACVTILFWMKGMMFLFILLEKKNFFCLCYKMFSFRKMEKKKMKNWHDICHQLNNKLLLTFPFFELKDKVLELCILVFVYIKEGNFIM
jgi:hypothetical protein